MSLRVSLFVLLTAATFASAVSVVYVKHLNRKLFIELQTLERERDRMQEEWGQLLLEQSTWATQERVERIARDRLDLDTPPPNRIVLVTE